MERSCMTGSCAMPRAYSPWEGLTDTIKLPGPLLSRAMPLDFSAPSLSSITLSPQSDRGISIPRYGPSSARSGTIGIIWTPGWASGWIITASIVLP